MEKERHMIAAREVHRYLQYLRDQERAPSTIEKYRRALVMLMVHTGGNPICKESVVDWKNALLEQGYTASSVNVMLVAVNGFFALMGWYECRVKPLKQQRTIFRDKSRELTKAEYLRLLETARTKGQQRLYFLMETLCATGIRISELRYITVDAVQAGRATVAGKGKLRVVLLPKKLRKALLRYCRERGILSGPVFVTNAGRPINRSNVWREMKRLCEAAGVFPGKVFPHNLRHLFAVTFYRLEKDIAKLADLLGHASIDTTRIYIMESGDEHIRRLERLGLVV